MTAFLGKRWRAERNFWISLFAFTMWGCAFYTQPSLTLGTAILPLVCVNESLMLKTSYSSTPAQPRPCMAVARSLLARIFIVVKNREQLVDRLMALEVPPPSKPEQRIPQDLTPEAEPLIKKAQ